MSSERAGTTHLPHLTGEHSVTHIGQAPPAGVGAGDLLLCHLEDVRRIFDEHIEVPVNQRAVPSDARTDLENILVREELFERLGQFVLEPGGVQDHNELRGRTQQLSQDRV